MTIFPSFGLVWAGISLILWTKYLWSESKLTTDVVGVSALVAWTWPLWGVLLLYDFLRGPNDKISGAD